MLMRMRMGRSCSPVHPAPLRMRMRMSMACSPKTFFFFFLKGQLPRGRIRTACLQDRAGHTDEGEAPAWWKNTVWTGCSVRHTKKKGVDCGQAEHPRREHKATASSRCRGGGKTGQSGCLDSDRKPDCIL